MALPSAIKLFINPRTGLAFGNFNGTSQITNPTVTLGDTARFEIYLVEDTGINTYPRQEIQWPGTPGIKIAVGPIDESPQAGTWKVSFGGDTTAALAYNVTATALAAALNGLASITSAGGVTVSKIGDNYNIVFNQNGARGDILTDGAALIPLSNATVAKLQIGDSTRPQIALVHLQRTIAGLATSFTATAASAIAIESLSAWDGSRATYRVSIAPDPKGGSFSLAFYAATGTDVSSASIAVGASAIDVQNALNKGALVDKVSVSQIGAYYYDITVTAQPGTGGLTANGAGLISFNGYVGELSLNTAEAISLLDGAEEVSTNLEVEVTSEGKALTVLQIPCTLKNAVIDSGSIQPLVLDSYLSQAAADGRYTRQANNLSDLADINATRTNLGVYSTSSVDTALSLKANLSGATFSGNIVRDNGLGQTIIAPGSIGFSQTGGGGAFATYGSTAITFADGTVQSTAFTGTASTAWGTISGSLSSQVDLTNALAGKAATVHSHIIGDVTGLQTALDGKAAVSHTQAISTVTGLQSALDGKAATSHSQAISTITGLQGALDAKAATVHSHIIGDVTGLQTALDGKAATSHTQAISTVTGLQSALDGKAATVHSHIIGDVTGLQSALDGKAATSHSQAISTVTGLQGALDAKANLSGANFTGKVNATSVSGAAGINVGIGGTSAAATVAGDVWITTGGASLNFRDGTGAWRVLAATSNTQTFSAPQIIDTTATTPGLRITQKGAGSALVVEDSTTPDSDALIVDANGNLGIGVSNNPGNIWTGSTYKVEVQGSALVNGLLRVGYQLDVGTSSDLGINLYGGMFFADFTWNGSGGKTFSGITTQSNSNVSGNFSYNEYPEEVIVKLNGVFYAIPARQVA